MEASCVNLYGRCACDYLLSACVPGAGLTTDQDSLSLDGESAGGGESKEQLLEPYLNAFAAFRDDIRSAAREGKPRVRNA